MNTCTCWSDKQEALKDKGYCISQSCTSLVITTEGMKVQHLLPIERLDRKRPKRNEPVGIQISHCPFCGTKFAT